MITNSIGVSRCGNP